MNNLEKLKDEKLLNAPFKTTLRGFSQKPSTLVFIFEVHEKINLLIVNNNRTYQMLENLSENELNMFFKKNKFNFFSALNIKLEIDYNDVLNNNIFTVGKNKEFNFTEMSYSESSDDIIKLADNTINEMMKNSCPKEDLLHSLYHRDEPKPEKEETLDELVKKYARTTYFNNGKKTKKITSLSDEILDKKEER